jgi:predicted MFS family arabinose efflux permease
VLVSLWMIRTDELRRPPAAKRGRGQVRAGLRYVHSQPELWVPLVMMAVVGTLAFNFQVVFPLFTVRDLGGDETLFTLLFSVVSIGSLIGALATARRTTVDVHSVARASVLFGAAMLLMALVPGAAWAFPAGLLVGLGSIAFLTTSTSIVQLRADPSMRGRVLALQAMVFLGSTPIGGPILGWIAEELGARYAIGVGAAAALGAGVWGLSVVRRNPIGVPSEHAGARESTPEREPAEPVAVDLRVAAMTADPAPATDAEPLGVPQERAAASSWGPEGR